jgi:hypothetical protein
MKKKSSLVLVLLFFTSSLFSQNEQANIKFQDAELDFVNDNYKNALTNLDEADQFLGGKIDPKILYLRILSQFNLLKINKEKDLDNINVIRNNCKKYFNLVDDTSKIEDKYNEIMEISERLNNVANAIKIKNLPVYDQGQNLYFEKKYLESLPLLKSASSKGNMGAMYYLGLIYYYGGDGVSQDRNAALEWFLKAAELTYTDAYEMLGDTYRFSKIDPINYYQAFKWYKLSSNVEEDERIVSMLGAMYYYGLGTDINKKLALQWYIKGAEKGNDVAQYALGEMYWNGEGVEKNKILATEWYKKSAKQNNKNAIERLNINN